MPKREHLDLKPQNVKINSHQSCKIKQITKLRLLKRKKAIDIIFQVGKVSHYAQLRVSKNRVPKILYLNFWIQQKHLAIKEDKLQCRLPIQNINKSLQLSNNEEQEQIEWSKEKHPQINYNNVTIYKP